MNVKKFKDFIVGYAGLEFIIGTSLMVGGLATHILVIFVTGGVLLFLSSFCFTKKDK